MFSPAIVTKKDTFITRENCHNYVSKISKNPDNEFNKAKHIVKRLESASIDAFSKSSPGWFPLQLHCFHIDTALDVKKFLPEKDLKSANSKCEHIINRIFQDKTKNQTICITQSEKFDTTLDNYLYTCHQDEKLYLHDESYKKLNIMHNLGIYHLDIKGPNMALKKKSQYHDIYFTDWDLAFCAPDNLTLQERNIEYLEAIFFVYEHYKYYFRVLTKELYENNDITLQQAFKIQDNILNDNVFKEIADSPNDIEIKKNALSKIDKLNFMAMWSDFYHDLSYIKILDILNNPHKTPLRAQRNAVTLPLPKSPTSQQRSDRRVRSRTVDSLTYSD